MRAPTPFRVVIAAVALLVAAAVTACTAQQPQSEESSKSEYATPIDLMNARVDCLEGKGWTVEVDEEAAQFRINTASDDEQLKLEQDDAACYEELGVDPNRTLTSGEFDLLYDQYQEGAECLRDFGADISQAPSRQVFSEEYYTDPWLPWAQVAEAEYDAALEVCPMPPPVL